MRFASVAATGRCVPERVVTNAELETRLGEPVDQWLVAKVGIRERRVMAEGETTSDLAARAARQCLERAGRAAGELDLVVVATDTPDYLSPATASVVGPSWVRAAPAPSTSTAPAPHGSPRST